MAIGNELLLAAAAEISSVANDLELSSTISDDAVE
jgi:hypothetical protein